MSDLYETASYTFNNPLNDIEPQFPKTVIVQLCTELHVAPGVVVPPAEHEEEPTVHELNPFDMLNGVLTSENCVVAVYPKQLLAPPKSINKALCPI